MSLRLDGRLEGRHQGSHRATTTREKADTVAMKSRECKPRPTATCTSSCSLSGGQRGDLPSQQLSTTEPHGRMATQGSRLRHGHVEAVKPRGIVCHTQRNRENVRTEPFQDGASFGSRTPCSEVCHISLVNTWHTSVIVFRGLEGCLDGPGWEESLQQEACNRGEQGREKQAEIQAEIQAQH